jgi:serine/threonine-protein kinase
MVVGTALLSALVHAHGRGVIHRDVKPGNVLIGPHGEPLLCDFGIAVLEADRSRNTLEGLSLGTLAFMAPEQRMDARSVDERADVYAMGATLYELATGRTAADLFMAPADSPRFNGLPPRFIQVIRQATRYRPDERFEGAADMLAALQEAQRCAPAVPAVRPYV